MQIHLKALPDSKYFQNVRGSYWKSSDRVFVQEWPLGCTGLYICVYLCINVCLWDIQPNFGEFPWLQLLCNNRSFSAVQLTLLFKVLPYLPRYYLNAKIHLFLFFFFFNTQSYRWDKTIIVLEIFAFSSVFLFFTLSNTKTVSYTLWGLGFF